jgi:hypothetical protein
VHHGTEYVNQDTIDCPKFLGKEKYSNADPDYWLIKSQEAAQLTQRDKWADRLWPTMAWFIFLFNVFVSGTFCIRMLISTDGIDTAHAAAMYITISITMCGTYMALMWAHYNILRKKDGLG